MTPNIASVISSASNANGSASAFLFAAASEPEAAFSVPFPEAYARRTTTERQSQTIHIDPRPRALLSPPPRSHESPVSRRASRRIRMRLVPRARARVRVDFSPLSSSSRARLRTHRRDTITPRQSPHASLVPSPPARASLIIPPQRPPRPIASAVASPRASRVIVHARRYRAPADARSHRENVHTHRPSNSRAGPTPYASSRAS